MYERYSRIRDMKGLRDSDVAARTGISKTAFSEWKSGRSTPKYEKLKAIADCLNVPLSAILEDSDSSENSNNSMIIRNLEEQNALLKRLCDAQRLLMETKAKAAALEYEIKDLTERINAFN